MPVRTLPGTDLSYALVVFDEKGNERPEPDGTFLSETLASASRIRPGRHRRLLHGHGWKGDVPAAIEQFDRWIGAVAVQPADIAAAASRPGGFAPLIVGLHWPSLPFGDEDVSAGGGAVLSAATAIGEPPRSRRLGRAHRRHAARARGDPRPSCDAARQETGRRRRRRPRCSTAYDDALRRVGARRARQRGGARRRPGGLRSGGDHRRRASAGGGAQPATAAARHRRHLERRCSSRRCGSSRSGR